MNLLKKSLAVEPNGAAASFGQPRRIFLIPLVVASQLFRRHHQVQFLRMPDDCDQ
jgi:hypothetical protein